MVHIYVNVVRRSLVNIMDLKNIWPKVLKGLKWFFFSYIWLFILFLVVDIVTKQAVVNYFRSHDNPIVLIGSASKPFLQISYSINTNAAFGFGMENPVANRVLYCVIAFIGFGLILGFYIWKNKKINSLVKACLMLMCVGAVGNLIDRLFYSPDFLHYPYNGVVDWIDFIGIWPFIFNIADSCVVIGVLILIVYLIVDEVKEMKRKRSLEIKETNGKVLSKEEQSRLQKVETKEVSKEEEKVKE